MKSYPADLMLLLASARATSHYLTLPHTTSHYLTLPHTTSHYLTLPHTTSHYLTLPHTTSHYLTLPHTTSHYLTLPHTTSHYLTLPHITSHYLTLPHTTSHNPRCCSCYYYPHCSPSPTQWMVAHSSSPAPPASRHTLSALGAVTQSGLSTGR